VVTSNGAQLTSSAATGNQWYFEGSAIPGATGKYYTATQTGNYWVMVTLNGCSSVISNKVYVLITGTDEQSPSALQIFPVPNMGEFTIRISGNSGVNARIRIYNPLGIITLEKTQILKSGQTEIPVQLENPVNGVYSVVVNFDDQSIIRKVVINR
jgi:hypothetical protein